MNDTERLFADIAAWSAATFPSNTARSTMAHLQREVEELCNEIDFHFDDKHSVGMEMADVAFLLIQLARVEEIDLLEAIRAKFAINKSRTWQPPDASGVVEHVRP